MRVVPRALLLIGVASILLGASPGSASDRPSLRDMLKYDSNEEGFTISGLLEMNVGQLARRPLSPETLSRVSADVHRPPQRGVQIELLSPGDFGATVHFRW